MKQRRLEAKGPNRIERRSAAKVKSGPSGSKTLKATEMKAGSSSSSAETPPGGFNKKDAAAKENNSAKASKSGLVDKVVVCTDRLEC